MGRLRRRQKASIKARRQARARIDAYGDVARMMTPAAVEQDYLDRLRYDWRGNWSVLVFLFAMPDDPVIRSLDSRGEYFDIRTGDLWDLFFPGYYRSTATSLERSAGSAPVGTRYAKDWYFNPSDFDQMRRHIGTSADSLWNYSGGADLVLVNTWIPDHGDPTIDWASVQAGAIDPAAEPQGSLAGVVEKITHDLEEGNEDPSHGVGAVTKTPAVRTEDGTGKKIMIGALAGILATLGSGRLGL